MYIIKMTTLNFFRVYCTASTNYEYIWSTTIPTVCPSDGSPIDTSQTVVTNSINVGEVINIDDTFSPYTATTEGIINADTTNGNITITLPPVIDNPGKIYNIIKTSASNTLTILPNGSDTINGIGSIVLTNLGESITITNDSISDWSSDPLDIEAILGVESDVRITNVIPYGPTGAYDTFKISGTTLQLSKVSSLTDSLIITPDPVLGDIQYNLNATGSDFQAGVTVNTDVSLNTAFVNLSTVNNTLLSGSVTWNTGLIFDVTDTEAIINGLLINTDETQVTLSTADPTNARIDVIYIDDTGTIGFLTGTPSPSPIKPSLLYNQLELTFATIAAAATQPTGMSSLLIYDEDIGSPEWIASTSAPARIDVNSTNDPYNGTISMEGTNVLTSDSITLTPPAPPYDLTNSSNLQFRIKPKAGWNNQDVIIIFFMNGTSRIGDRIIVKHKFYGFKKNNLNYQLINIPLSNFNFATEFDTTSLKFTFGGDNPGFFLDVFKISQGNNDPGAVPGTVSANSVSATNSISNNPGAIPTEVDNMFITSLGSGQHIIMFSFSYEVATSSKSAAIGIYLDDVEEIITHRILTTGSNQPSNFTLVHRANIDDNVVISLKYTTNSTSLEFSSRELIILKF